MADDKTPFNPDVDLPTPDESPFFGSGAAEKPAAAEDTEPAPDAAPASDAEPASDSAEQPPSGFALGDTEPHDFSHEVDPAAAQLTQMLPILEQTEIPPFDSQAAQLTQVVPVVTASEIPPEETTPVLTGPSFPTVTAGSRVVIVVSRGPSSIPPAAVIATPHVIGVSQGEALGKLQEAGLSAQVFNEYSDLPRGEVIAQTPAFGESAAAGSEAVLLVSGGPAPAETLSVPLPNVVGLSEADALAILQDAGLLPQVVRDFSANVPLGVVVDQVPSGQSIAGESRKKRPLWWLWALLGVALLVAVGGGIYYYLNRTAAVPNLVGLSQAKAEQAIIAAGFNLGSLSTTQTISASEVGKVTSQTPPPNTQFKMIDQVDIVVSGGQKLFAIPGVTGKPQAEARSILTSAGLQVSSTTAYSAVVPKDSVVSQSPAAGERVPSGTTVGITVSLGAQSVTVPGVGGQTRSQAANSLKAANLSSQAVIEYTLTGTTKGLVFGQYPTAGMSVPPGTIVGILVSNGQPTSNSTATVSVPSVVGQSQKSAAKTLSKISLGNTTINWSGTGRPAGEVVGQAPEAGQYVPKKVAVIVFVSNGK